MCTRYGALGGYVLYHFPLRLKNAILISIQTSLLRIAQLTETTAKIGTLII
jgi:hypothetical protein